MRIRVSTRPFFTMRQPGIKSKLHITDVHGGRGYNVIFTCHRPLSCCIASGSGSLPASPPTKKDSSSEGRLTPSIVVSIVAAIVTVLINTLREEKV